MDPSVRLKALEALVGLLVAHLSRTDLPFISELRAQTQNAGLDWETQAAINTYLNAAQNIRSGGYWPGSW